MDTTTFPAAAALHPVWNANGDGVGVVEFVDARATRAPWIAHAPGFFGLSHRFLEDAEWFILTRLSSRAR